MRARGLKLVDAMLNDREAQSRPMPARGLKPDIPYAQLLAERVAPHAGAWIETVQYLRTALSAMSRPMRARGLKQCHVV